MGRISVSRSSWLDSIGSMLLWVSIGRKSKGIANLNVNLSVPIPETVFLSKPTTSSSLHLSPIYEPFCYIDSSLSVFLFALFSSFSCSSSQSANELPTSYGFVFFSHSSFCLFPFPQLGINIIFVLNSPPSHL